MTTIMRNDNGRQTTDAQPLLDDLAYICTVMVNVYFVGSPNAGDREWVLIDAGMLGAADQIIQAAETRYGRGSRPAAIILTHGHFDHVGALDTLAKRWDAPIYAHTMELPYLTGRASYPPPDPSVGGGLVSALSWSFPRGPIDLKDGVKPLPGDGTVPYLRGWRWIFTPGHTPGHIVLFRDADKTLIAGDAIVTTQQESLLAVRSQRRELHGPPKYYTPDWDAAASSVAILAELNPEIAATGHGEPLRGSSMRADLHDLADNFHRRAVPKHGRYVKQPAVTNENGIVSIPPEMPELIPDLLLSGDAIAKFMQEFLGTDAAMQ